MAESGEVQDGRASELSPARPKARDQQLIKAELVSGLLDANRSLLDRSSSTAERNLTEVSRSIGDVYRASQGPSSPLAAVDGPSILHDPARVNLLGANPPVGWKDAETHQGEAIGPGSPSRGQSTPDMPAIVKPSSILKASSSASPSEPPPVTMVGPPTVVGTANSGVVPTSGATVPAEGVLAPTSREGDVQVPGTRISPTTTTPLAGGGRVDPGLVDDSVTRTNFAPGPRSGPSVQAAPDLSPHAGNTRDPEDFSKGATVPSVGLAGVAGDATTPPGSRGLDGPQMTDSRASSPGFGLSSSSDSSSPAGPSMNLVRNPLSTDLMNSAMAGSSTGGQGPASSNPGGLAQATPGGSPSLQDQGPGDLSKTNELLQQLLDAVRKQRGSSLPAGGPAVYSDR